MSPMLVHRMQVFRHDSNRCNAGMLVRPAMPRMHAADDAQLVRGLHEKSVFDVLSCAQYGWRACVA